MSAFPQKKSNKRLLVLANNDVGLYRFRKDLLAELSKLGYEVYISLPNGQFIPELEELGFHYMETDLSRRGMNPVKDLGLLRKYRRILRDVAPDLVITYTIKPNIYGGLACRMAHIPYAVNITGLGSAIENGGLLKKLVLSLYRPALKRARVIFFENSGNHATLEATGILPHGRSVVLNGAGVNLDDFPYAPYPDGEIIKFLFVGRVMHEKGIDEFFAAARKLKALFGDRVEFHVVGSFEEEYRAAMDEQVRDGTVIYHGQQPDVRPFYRAAHCIVLPSYHEGMSNVLLEAAATGRPIITSDIPGCREAVSDGSGYLCPARDADALAATIQAFCDLSPQQKESMGRQSRTHMAQYFDKKIVVSQTLELLLSQEKQNEAYTVRS